MGSGREHLCPCLLLLHTWKSHLQGVCDQESEKPPIWVVLDEVQDPQNVCVVLRSTYFLEAKGVIVCTKNSTPSSVVVSKASSRALKLMEL